MKVTILDGYVDEPSRLGVPPFIAPYPRYVIGAVLDAGHDYEYLTIDHLRSGKRPTGQMLFVIWGALVPGRYLRTMPMSKTELTRAIEGFEEESLVWTPIPGLGVMAPLHITGCDPDAFIYDYLTSNERAKRRRTPKEWHRWALKGAVAIKHHQDFPQPLIAEVDMSYGCPRYITGGCSFCIEPLYGEPVYREPDSVTDEVKALLKLGCANFRLGGQSCIISYHASGIGDTETPRPNVEAHKKLFKTLVKMNGIRVLHTDNADPSVIAQHRGESREILEMIVRVCTCGNVLSLGVENADPTVIELNNLNTTIEEAMAAIRLINKVGAKRGPTGLPMLLPGLNFITGLEGETPESYSLNLDFLTKVLDSNLIVRRINIRQVSPLRRDYPRHDRNMFIRFKTEVRERIDRPMLRRVASSGTVLTDAYTELYRGNLTYARQIGTYPILIGVPYRLGLGRFVDVKVTAHGSRSLTAVEHPLDINACLMAALESIPGVGRRRAARIVRARPISTKEELVKALGHEDVSKRVTEYVIFKGGG
jgi:radical SAM superfamily enzyme with C-terminal helix-hairpin-helix motif